MRALIYDRYGTPDELRVEEVERDPASAPVRSGCAWWRARSTTGTATSCGAARFDRAIAPLRPRHRVLGSDVAGVVERVAPDVVGLAPGDEVMADLSSHGFGRLRRVRRGSGVSVERRTHGSLARAGCRCAAGRRSRGHGAPRRPAARAGAAHRRERRRWRGGHVRRPARRGRRCRGHCRRRSVEARGAARPGCAPRRCRLRRRGLHAGARGVRRDRRDLRAPWRARLPPGAGTRRGVLGSGCGRERRMLLRC